MVTDDLTGDDWTITLDEGESQILSTTYTNTEADMDISFVENTATAEVNQTTVTDTETVSKVEAPPQPIPLSTWALVLGGHPDCRICGIPIQALNTKKGLECRCSLRIRIK